MKAATHTRLVNIDSLKREIADAVTIADVARDVCDVELMESGHQARGLCPLHSEDTPSFYVHEGKGVFKCWGCQASGDAITLVQLVHNVDFKHALAMLAEAAGVDIGKYVRAPTDEERALDELRSWSESWLDGLAPETSRVSAETALALGVRAPSEPRERHPYFDDKRYLLGGEALFEYRTASGGLVGWKTRHDGKKMFRTPAGFPLTEPTLFGLNVAREHAVDGRLVVIEGEYDVAVLHDHGIQEAVASGGSALTDDQMDVLSENKIREIVCWFDGDTGGLTAAESVAKRYWDRSDVRVRVGTCMPGADPEDMIRAMGPEAVREQLARVPHALEYLLRREYEREERVTMGQKLAFVRWVHEEYGARLSGVEQALVLREVARWLDVPDADVQDFVRADKTMLQVVDSEKVVLGKAVRSAGYFVQVRKRIDRHDFFVLKHQRLWDVLTTMMIDGVQGDIVALKRYAEAQDIRAEYIETLVETGDQNLEWHEDQLVEMAIRRGTQNDADRFRDLITDLSVPVGQVVGTLTQAVTSRVLQRDSASGITDQVDEAMELLHARMASPDKVTGLDIGAQWPLVMRSIDGLQSRRLILLAATSGAGKSTMALQWFAALSVYGGVPTDFISLEMDPPEILYKQVAHLTGIDSMKVSGGRLDKEELKRVERAMSMLRKSPMRIHAPDGITPSEIVLYAREAMMDRRTELIGIDYAQMVGPDPDMRSQSRYEQLGHFAYTMKQKVCRGLDVAVVCCAQLNRQAKFKDEPSPEDMGDSYELVRASDVILLIGGRDDDEAHPELFVGKNRCGPSGVQIPMHRDLPAQTFRESAGIKVPEYRLLSA